MRVSSSVPECDSYDYLSAAGFSDDDFTPTGIIHRFRRSLQFDVSANFSVCDYSECLFLLSVSTTTYTIPCMVVLSLISVSTTTLCKLSGAGIQLAFTHAHSVIHDHFLYDFSADDYTHGYMQALAMVKYDGGVFWPPIVKLRSTCQLNMAYFPFDDQLCKLKLGSWAYDGFQVNVDNRTTPIDLSNFVGNGEWELIGVTVQRNVVYYPCCVEPFPDVTFMIHVQRRTLYYTYNVIIPCIMLSILTLMGFWMRPDSGEKVTLGLTVLLAFSVFMLLIAENMPATSNHVPLIGRRIT